MRFTSKIKRLFPICLNKVSVLFLFGLYMYFSQIELMTTNHKSNMAFKMAAKLTSIPNSAEEYTTTTVATKHHTLASYTTRRQFVKMKYGGVYLFGATMGNSSSNATWDLVKIYGGFDRSEYRNPDFQCCLNYKDGSDFSLAKVKPYKTRRFQPFSVIWSVHVTCPNIRNLQNAIPIGVSLTVGNHNCTKSEVKYIKPHFPLREAQAKVAIATKIAYGNISAELIIEWMEWYKLIEVDKVMTFYLKSLNEEALKVLQFYASTGILDLHLYEPAASDKNPRDTYNDHHQRQNDQQIVVVDSFERLAGYRYFAILDFDEFLMPLHGKTIKGMMALLERFYPKAAGINFLVQYFYTSWGKTEMSDCDLFLCSYTQRNRTRRERSKNILIPDRIAPGSIDTHLMRPREGYFTHKGHPALGIVHHFRHCRQNKQKQCMTEYGRTTDLTVAAWAQQIKQNVAVVRKTVFGSRAFP